MEINTDPHLILYRGVIFDKDSDFIKSFYKYNKAPPLKGAVTSFTVDENIVINWISQYVNSDQNRYFFIISTIVPIGFPIFNIPDMHIGGNMEEIALPNIYKSKHLMLHLLSKKHLSLSGPEFAKDSKSVLSYNPNFYILNCSLSYEAAPFEESKISKRWLSWDTRFKEYSAKIKASINDISKEEINGIKKIFYTSGDAEFLDLSIPKNNSICQFSPDDDDGYIYLTVDTKEILEKCKVLSGLSGWYDLHKEL